LKTPAFMNQINSHLVLVIIGVW